MKYPLMINCQPLEADVDPDTPLLWVLRDTLKLKGTQFGCGMAQCGACPLHLVPFISTASSYAVVSRRLAELVITRLPPLRA